VIQGSASRDESASAPTAVDTESTEARKRISDAFAYIRGRVQTRGRNIEWAESAGFNLFHCEHPSPADFLSRPNRPKL
jgi:hypothetical protein